MHLVTRAELARKKGISRGAVTHAAKASLAEAVVGSLIDLNHPATQAWLAESPRGAEGSANLNSGQGGDNSGGAEGSSAPPDAESHLHKMQALNRQKRAEEVRRLAIMNAIAEGKYISRELVDTHVFGLLEVQAKTLLRDATVTIATRAFHMSKTDSIEQIKTMVRGVISAQLLYSKQRIVKVLRGDPDDEEKPEKRGQKSKSRKTRGRRSKDRRTRVAGAAIRGAVRRPQED